MNVRGIIGIGAIAGTLLLSGCKEGVYERTKKYMSEAGHTQKDLVTVTNSVSNYEMYSNDKAAALQSKLDSVAFRDVFMSAKAKNDSSAAAELGKITSKSLNTYQGTMEALINTGIKISEYQKITDQAKSYYDAAYYEFCRYAADSLIYRKFFEEYKLLDTKTLEKFNKVCKSIKPKPGLF